MNGYRHTIVRSVQKWWRKTGCPKKATNLQQASWQTLKQSELPKNWGSNLGSDQSLHKKVDFPIRGSIKNHKNPQ